MVFGDGNEQVEKKQQEKKHDEKDAGLGLQGQKNTTDRGERVECVQISLVSQGRRRGVRYKKTVAEDSGQNTRRPEQRHEVINAVGKAEQSELELRATGAMQTTLECLQVDADRMITLSAIGRIKNHIRFVIPSS